jgi:DNA-binding CsgD family transcriptional regulator
MNRAPIHLLGRSLKERCDLFAGVIARLDRARMSKRQLEVADLRTAGLSFAAIGAQLGISAARARQIAARLLSRARLEARLAGRSRRRLHFG